MKDFIPVNEPLLNGNEKKYLNECIDSGWISSEGPFVEKFETNFSKLVNRSYGIAVTNGTAAIDAVIQATNIKPGDEIILPAFTIISCVGQIIRSGAKPVLVDCDPVTWNMNVDEIESKITTKTRAIMVVHIYGLPVEMNKVMEIANRYNLLVIEDAAEVHGQKYKDKPCGSFGDISTFSFYPNKHITTGEGGMIVTNDSKLASRCRSIRNLCFKAEERFVHDEIGWNMRMTNIQAALGVAQLERIEEFIQKKRNMGNLYNELLKDLPNVQKPLPKNESAENIYWVYGLVIDSSLKITAKEVLKSLSARGIGCRPFFCPMNQQPVLKNIGLFKNEDYPEADRLYKYGFYIPSGLAITEEQQRKVATTLIEVLG